MKEKALVLFSGGQDSTTCLFWAKQQFDEVEAVAFNYGQRHRSELEAANNIAEKAGVKFQVLHLDLISELTSNALTSPDVAVEKEKPDDTAGSKAGEEEKGVE